MIRSMPHKQSSNTIYLRAADADNKHSLLRECAKAYETLLPHILKRGGRWECWTTPGDHSMSARQARDWVRLANFKLENAP